ncbi:MAG TPA: glycosyltransferase family 4 protein [Actinomycetota bacterium]
MGGQVTAGRPVRVLLVNPSPIRGGAEEMLAAFLRGFDPARIEATVACLAPGPFPDELIAAGHHVHSIDAGRMRQVRRYERAVRAVSRPARKADLVCSWQVKGHYYGTPAARIARRPAVWWDHGIRPKRGEQSAFAAGTIPKLLSARLVLTSSHAAAVRHARAVAIHPGIDTERFASARASQRAASRAAFGVAPDEPLVGIVGRLQPWKGQHVFLRAAARVASRQPRAKFLIAGDALGGFSAAYPDELRTLAADLGIADRVIFAGARDDVPAVLAALDVFVHASVEEPFGIVIVEALAARVPVVATRGGGVGEIVTDGVDGYLVGCGDNEAMAARIDSLVSKPSVAARLAAAGQARARSAFTAERMVEQFTAVLERFAPRRIKERV